MPPDWTDPNAFRLDYLTYIPTDLSLTDPPFIPTNWELLTPTEEGRQMIAEFSTPLTQTQMNMLAIPMGQ